MPGIWDIKRAKALKASVPDLTELAKHLSLISLKTEVGGEEFGQYTRRTRGFSLLVISVPTVACLVSANCGCEFYRNDFAQNS